MSLQTRKQVAQAVKAVESKKGEDIAILEMDQAAGAFTDYFVICSGTNTRQIQAISDEVERLLGESGLCPNSREGYSQAEWVLLDYVDFVVHVFSERARKFYDLERLWRSANRLKLAELAKPAKPAPSKRASAPAGKAASTKSAKNPTSKNASATTANAKSASAKSANPNAKSVNPNAKSVNPKTRARPRGSLKDAARSLAGKHQ